MRAILWFAASVALFGAASAAQAAIYQKVIVFPCPPSSNTCKWNGPAVPAGKTLTISTISCVVIFDSAATPTTGTGKIGMVDVLEGFQTFVFSVIVKSQAMAPTQSVPYTFVSGRAPVVSVQMNSIVNGSAFCTLRGTMTP